MTARRWCTALACGVLLAVAGGCAARRPAPAPAPRPSVAPTSQPSASLQIDPANVKPMYREMLPVDLPTVIKVAAAQNLDIEQARHRVEADRGRYEASVGALFPVIGPAFTFNDVQGVGQNANGTLSAANFNTIVPAVLLQWIINPGRVAYDIVAAKKRLRASSQLEDAAQLDALRTAAVQYYDLILTQAKVAVARQAVAQAEEALRLTHLRARAGTGLAADELRSKAFLAGRQQDLIVALNAFYEASVALTVTLHLDPTVTLVPAPREIDQVTLVEPALAVDQLMTMAVNHRPDLKAARTLLAAVRADKSAVVWGALGPQLQAAYSYGGIEARVSGNSSGLQEQRKATAGAGFAFGVSSFGHMKIARANLRSAATDAERQLNQIRAEVVSAQQASITTSQLVPIAREQVDSAEEALRLAQANLKSGTMLLLDVLQAQNEVDAGRLRYADAVVRYNQAQINMLASLGLLDSPTLTNSTTQPAE
jgi:outer membrane protein TolC